MHSYMAVHRDLKCENILIKRSDPLTVKVADFGFARFIGMSEVSLRYQKKFATLDEVVEASKNPTVLAYPVSLQNEDKPGNSNSKKKSSTIWRYSLGKSQSKSSRISSLKDRESVHQADELDHLTKTFCGSLAYSSPELLLGQYYDGRKVDVWALGCIIFICLTNRMAYKGKRGPFDVIHQQQVGLMWPGSQKKTLDSLGVAFVQRMLTYDYDLRPLCDELLEHTFLSDNERERARTITDVVSLSG